MATSLRHRNSHGSSASPIEGAGEPWQAGSWRRFPFLTVLCLVGAVISMTIALVVLIIADDAQVDHWTLAPTVYLSIITTLTNAFLRFAFHASTDVFWWSQLLSQRGTSLQDLHSIWELAHSLFSLVKFPNASLHLHLRFTALLVFLTAVNGPLLQRAVTVDVTTRMSVRETTLPIRQEPMWNLTTKRIGFDGHVWSAPPYQDEFAEIVQDLNQRRPLTLSSPACAPNSTCTAKVTVAGFTYSCSDSEISLRGAPSLGQANRIFLPEAMKGYRCFHTGFDGTDDEDSLSVDGDGSSDLYCGYMETDFQLALETVYPGFEDGPDGDEDEAVPWKGENLPPAMFKYTTYVREDSDSDTLSVRQCYLSTAFLELPIQITQENVVTLMPSEDASSPATMKSRNGVESIPAAVAGSLGENNLFTKGILQVLNDLYGGFILYDKQEGSHFIQGTGPRQYIDQSTVKLRDDQPTEGHTPNQGYTFSCLDPLADVLSTLDEISLRYALKSMPESEVRSDELAEFMEDFDNGDTMDRAAAAMDMAFSKDLKAEMTEERTVAVYRAHYVYTGIAMGVTYLATLLTLSLLRGFQTHGREFTMSPLELAKAFNAPVLRHIGSNSSGSDISQATADIAVKYGEVQSEKESQQPMLVRGHSEYEGAHQMKSVVANDEIRQVEEQIMSPRVDETARLMIEVAAKVNKPTNGRVYA